MDTDTSSVAASRDGRTLRHGESVYDEYDEMSNMTVGTSSPRMQLGAKSPHSDSKSRMSMDPMTPSFDASVAPVRPEPPQQLPLNNHNLHGFARRVEMGGVPLRLDVIPDDAYVDYTAATVEVRSERKPADKHGDVSVLAAAGRTHDQGDLGSDAADSGTQYSNASLHGGEASIEGNAWNIERASVDPQVGSPTRHHTDPLSSANLDQHLHDLSRGPAPLRVENIVATEVPRPLRVGNADVSRMIADPMVVSVVAEASEADALSNSEVISARNLPTKVASVGDTMDDMWSTTSTRGPDIVYLTPGGASNDKLRALSKENLRQLRQQLESGETPLRPELLAGLGTMVRVMAQNKSNKSLSTAAEPAMTGERSKAPDVDTVIGSPLPAFAVPHGASSVASPKAPKDGETSALAGVSFHSTFVEAAATEAGDARAMDSSDFHTTEFLRPPRAITSDGDADGRNAVGAAGVGDAERGEEEEEDGEEGEEGEEGDALHEKTSSGGDSREGQNESVFNMTEDDGVDDMADHTSMSRHMRELFKLVQEGRRDQSHLRQLVLEQHAVITYLQSTVKGLKSELSALKKQ
ncbi:hypothetical protein NESM_000136600 [Novymonas esmeraldas]|uniref:Uncharacterized protein n=1 Tax=Novymonas esmeraldas TaxID=1808958 RepID=A0AAW0F377_9TRYP